MPNDENDGWHLPVRPVPVPPDVEAALANQPPAIALTKPDAPAPATRVERDAFMARHAPVDRQPPSMFTGRGDGEARGR